METAYSVIYLIAIIGFALCICGCLLRAVIGPNTMDRIVAVNMIGTMSILIIAVVSLYLDEEFLLDVDLIYAMLSFLAVVVLTKVYMGVHKEEQIRQQERLEKKEAKKEAKKEGGKK